MTLPSSFTGRVGIIQRLLAAYRKPFFEKLAAMPGVSLSVLSGQPLPDEAVKTTDKLEIARLWTSTNRYLQGRGGFLCWQSGMLTWLRKFNPDVLIVEANPRILSNWLAIWWMKRWKRPVLGWGLGELPCFGPSWLCQARSIIAKSLIHIMDGLIAYSSKAARDYIGAGVAADRVFIAYNAIDDRESERFLVQFGKDNSWIKAWKESLGFDPSHPIVLYVGRLIPQKKVDLLIQACAPPLKKCQLLVVGDGPARLVLEQQALPYGNRVRFLGHQSGEMLAKSFIASDLFVLPGSGGLAVHQAMSYGKPVIVSFGDGTEADLIREGVNGAFVRPSDVTDLRQKIADLLAQPELRQAMGQASLSIVRNEMSLEAMVASFYRVLTSVTNGRLESQ